VSLSPYRREPFLTTKALSSQKTCNTKLVVNFLNFSFITHTLKSNK
jgi:hypothetical protein